MNEGNIGREDDDWHWINYSSGVKKTFEQNVVPVSWVHSHVDGVPCGFSAVDMHTQFRLGEIGMFGMVFEIDKNNMCKKFDFYVLTEDGKNVVGACRNPAGVQHSSCFSEQYFCSVKSRSYHYVIFLV